MYIKVRVVKYADLESHIITNGLYEEKIINVEHIATATNKKVLYKEGGSFDICIIGLITGETIDIYGNAELSDGEILFKNEY